MLSSWKLDLDRNWIRTWSILSSVYIVWYLHWCSVCICWNQVLKSLWVLSFFSPPIFYTRILCDWSVHPKLCPSFSTSPLLQSAIGEAIVPFWCCLCRFQTTLWAHSKHWTSRKLTWQEKLHIIFIQFVNWMRLQNEGGGGWNLKNLVGYITVSSADSKFHHFSHGV